MQTNLTTNAANAAAAGIIVGGVSVFAIIFYILIVIAGWRILKKAGEAGWKILIPIYGMYMLYKIVDMKGWFWANFFLTIVGAVLSVIANDDLNAFNNNAIAIEESPMLITVAIFGFVSLVVAIITQIMYAYRTSKVFGHGLGFTIGLIFLPNIFWLIIAFGRSKYSKKAL
ncbi:hypothetical protein IJ117_01525 [Candidatus Saccharibacteria bacterium]|nr:hypothetical protein [Candidatus Saccharibacteria bacterium]